MTSRFKSHEQKPASRRDLLKGIGAAAGTGFIASFPHISRASDLSALKTVAPGKLTIAMNGDMPMTSVNDGEILGTDGEMISAIAKKLGLTPTPALMEWSATIESVRGGRADVMLGNMGWTLPRSEVMLITDPLYYTAKYTLMRKSEPISKMLTLENMKGRTLGTVTGFTIVPELRKVPGVAEVKLYDTTDACVRDVRAGRLDFGFLDTPTISYMIKQNPDWDLKVLPTQGHPDFKILGVKQITVMGMNPQNTDLFDAVNAGVKWLWDIKANAKFLDKYGIQPEEFTIPPPVNPRLGVDRDEKGNVIGKWAHTAKDYSKVFVGAQL